MKSDAGHMAYLDGWRGLAILMVLLAHFTPVHGIDLGRFGVDLFFVLSGLLMSRILFEQRTPIGRFYRRRASRILPAFVLFVVIIVAIFDLVGLPTSGQELAALLTFTSTYATDVWKLKAPLGHLWSLNVEEHCYLLLAVIAAIGAVRARAAAAMLGLAGLTLVAIAAHFLLSRDPNAPYLLNTECAATGLLASAGYRAIAHRWRPPTWCVPLAILAALACYAARVPWYAPVALSPFLLAFAVNHVGGCAPLRRVLEVRALGVLGLISYSVYLWQQPFYKFQAAFPFHTAVLGALALGACSFYFFESPIRRWLNANWRGRELVSVLPALVRPESP
ncbi:MAG TPA: acyltransferase [Steroidobacteraceae bacterium]|jgi:peptidoglycan/LPS O-acetylase OafA/YrhL|nr:acyltransferase [Steroidobacteraceae bacterium]